MELSQSPLFKDANLQAYYRFEGNSNHSGAGPDGSDTNISYDSSGKYGKEAVLNGSAYVNLGSSINLGGTDFTLIGWARLSSLPQDSTIIAQRSAQATDQQVILYYGVAGDLVLSFFNDDFHAGGGFTADNVFHQVAATFNHSTKGAIVYRDGVSIGSHTFSGVPSVGGSLTLGQCGFNIGANNYFNGGLDDFGIFNRVLTATEIANLYKAGINGMMGGI